MPRSCDLYVKRYDLKNVKQVLRRPMTLLVTLYCLSIGLAYDRALRNHVQKYYVVSLQVLRITHPTHLVCLRHWGVLTLLCETQYLSQSDHNHNNISL